MYGESFFAQALIYLMAAVVSVPIAKKLGLGSVLGYLIAGVVIGPFILGLVGDEGADVMHFAEFGVVMMLFLIGLELKPSLLWQMRKSIFGLGGLQLLITTVLITALAFLFIPDVKQALTIGLILSLSSTAIVLQTLNEKGILKNPAGQASFSVLLMQDIAVIPILAIIPLLATQTASHDTDTHGHGAAGFIDQLAGWQHVLLIVALVLGIIMAGRFLSRYIFRFIAEAGLREIFTAFALLLVIAIAMAMNFVGLSPALGTFIAGVVLADSEYRHELESDIEPFKGLLLGLFFIAVGAGIDFGLIVQYPEIIALGLLLLLASKFLVLFVLGKLFKLSKPHNLLFSFALAQGGEFAFVLISFSLQNNVLETLPGELLILIVALSMAITPLLLLLNEKIVQPAVAKKVNKEETEEITDYGNQVILAGFGRFGVMLGRLLIANGFKVTILDNSASNIQSLRRLGFKIFYGDAGRPDLLEAAGIGSAKVLILALDDKEKGMQIIEHVHKEHPHIKIFSRAYDVPHSFKLKKLNIDGLQRETYDSSLNLGKEVMCALGFTSFQATRAVRSFKHHDKRIMDELYDIYRTDSKRYFIEARKFSDQLEKILMAEHDHPIHDADGAWDDSTLREEIQKIYAAMEEDKKEEGGV